MKKIIYIIILFLFVNVVYAERISVNFSSCVDGDTAWLNINGKDKKKNAPAEKHTALR